MCTDSKSLFDVLIEITTPTKNRLLTNLEGMGEASELREVDKVIWIPSGQNPADGLMKKGPCEALLELIRNGRVDVKPKP